MMLTPRSFLGCLRTSSETCFGDAFAYRLNDVMSIRIVVKYYTIEERLMKIFILLVMIELHIVDDYYLQGILAKMKQKKWWNENAPQVLYRYDYVVALIAHSFSWSFFVTLPVVIYSSCVVSEPLVFVFVLNMIIHALVDDLKANKLKINLALDQTVHILQIVIVWLLFV